MTARSFVSRRAFTRTDCLAVLCVTLAGLAVASVAASPSQPGAARDKARQIKDSSQIRGIMQAMTIWAGNNRSSYPLPSEIDRDGATVAGSAPTKDTTANIFSLLIYNGSVPIDILISPVECNPRIKANKTYEWVNPKAALKPALALWDPAFSVDFTSGKTGSLSYAHLQPSGTRRERWADTFDASHVALATRAPEIKSVRYDGEKSATVELADPGSFTLQLFGQGKAWSGNVGFNDCHLEFAEKKIAPGSTFTALTAPHYTNAQGQKRLDTWCYDEPDDPEGANNFLGIFTKAGPKPADFTAIWD